MTNQKQRKTTGFIYDSTSTATNFSIDTSTFYEKGNVIYNHRKGTDVDVFNVWRRQETPEDCSRSDIKRAYRLGEWY
jgi:hypothetical protein